MSLIDKLTSDRICELNDAFRKTLNPALGRLMITAGVNALPAKVRTEALEKMRRFDAFTEDNDPYGEHDFGRFEIVGQKFFFKLDLYEEPCVKSRNEEKTITRIFTIMLAEEY